MRDPHRRQGGGRPVPWGLFAAVLGNTVLFFGIYTYFVMRRGYNWIFWLYLALLLATSLGYVIYNRAFAYANVTYDMLPSDWSEEKKVSFLAARDARKQRSKWLLVLIFPLAISLMVDVSEIYFGDTLYKTVASFVRGGTA